MTKFSFRKRRHCANFIGYDVSVQISCCIGAVVTEKHQVWEEHQDIVKECV